MLRIASSESSGWNKENLTPRVKGKEFHMERNCFFCGKAVHLYGFESLRAEDIFCIQCWIEDKLPKHFYLYNWRMLQGFAPQKKER